MRVRLTSLAAFARDRPVHVCRYGVSNTEFAFKRGGACNTETADPAYLVVLRALSALDTDVRTEYNLLFRNCELLATWCKLGERAGVSDFARDRAMSNQTHPLRLAQLAAVTAFLAAAAPEAATAALVGVVGTR